MPGLTNKTLTGYFETEYSSEWPGLMTNLPSSRIPPGACFSCNAMVVRGRLNPQPAIYNVIGTGGLGITLPTLAAGENVCAFENLQPQGAQQGFTVVITNFAVYIDYVLPNVFPTGKIFTKIFTFPTPYPRYARFGTKVIRNTLYFSSASQLGVYALIPTFAVVAVEVTNPGGYITGAPAAFLTGGGGTGPPIGSVNASGGNLTSVILTAGASSGYVSAPTLVVTDVSSPAAGQSLASGVGILSSFPTAYKVQEISAPTGVASITITAGGTGYVKPIAIFNGGGGSGASAQVFVNASGVVIGATITSAGANYSSPPSITIVDAANVGAGATGVGVLFSGTPFIGGDFMATMSQRLILGNIIGGDGNNTVPVKSIIVTSGGTGYVSPTISFVGGGGQGAAATATVAAGVITAITVTNGGNGYSTTPSINILDSAGTGASGIVQLGSIPEINSSTTTLPDVVAWSAPNAYGFFDPDFSIAPGGNNPISEAEGLVTSLNVVESVCFVGHNGGITEMTPNTSNAQAPFSFYPLWSADEGVLVRYGSMAQYGSTLCFLSEDNAYSMTPNGLTEIGLPIGNQLENRSSWNNGNFPLQGLYGSIVLVEGQKHYLISFSADDVIFAGNTNRSTQVFDYNMSENNWHFWTYSGFTQTCPIYQAFDTANYKNSATAGDERIARDKWILISWSTTVAANDQCVIYEVCPVGRQLQIGPGISFNAVVQPNLAYQFRTEAPSIARMQSERRIGIEYESIPSLTGVFGNSTLTLTYTGQQDPTTQTQTVSQQQVSSIVLTQINTTVIPGQILTQQADFGTFTGVCTTLGISSTGTASLMSLVRLTQVADLPKGQLP